MKDSPIRIEVEVRERTAIVRLEGRLVLGYLRDVENRILALLEEGVEDLIVNLGAVSHIGSSGLGLLLSIRNRLEASSGRLILAQVSPACKEALELTRMNEIFSLALTEEDALTQL